MEYIAFKAKSIKYNSWVYGSLVIFNGKHYICPRINEDKHMEFIEVDDKTICQHTDMQDSYGKDIFEGDIISCDSIEYGELGESVHYTNIGIVTWNKNKGQWFVNEEEENFELYEYLSYCDAISVISNVNNESNYSILKMMVNSYGKNRKH